MPFQYANRIVRMLPLRTQYVLEISNLNVCRPLLKSNKAKAGAG